MAISKIFGSFSTAPVRRGEVVIQVPDSKKDFVLFLLKLGVFDGKLKKQNVRLEIDDVAPQWVRDRKI